jgi:hypothetical protein
MNKDIQTIFENIRNEYGDVASWAVWKAPDCNNLVSNMEVDGLFDLDENPKILDQLNNNIIMVGINFSISTDKFPKLHNFHSYYGANINYMTLKNASKIRYAFNHTPYYGAYMTDIKKGCVNSKSENVELANLDDFKIFRKELETLQADKPLIIAFGGIVHTRLKKHLKPNEFSKLIKITHYAHYGHGCATHEGYRKRVLNELKNV